MKYNSVVTPSFRTVSAPMPSGARSSPVARLLLSQFLSALCLCLPSNVAGQTNSLIHFEGFDYLSEALLYIYEDSGTVTVPVIREGLTDLACSVQYRVTGEGVGLATPGLDFLTAEGTLEFGPNETNKSFSFTVLADSLVEGDEDFFIELDQATNGATIQTPELRVLIRDGERNPIRVDPDFKPDWPFHWPWHTYLGRPYPCVPQPDGKLVCVQAAFHTTGDDGALIIRLMTDGRRDPNWAAPVVHGSVGALCLQTNGQVLFSAMGLSGPDFTVGAQTCRHMARLNADGSVDASFATALPPDEWVGAIALQNDGQILVTLHPTNRGDICMLRRLNSSGSPDPSFREATIAVAGFGWEIVIFPMPDRSIVSAGTNGSVVRFLPDGSPDSAFSPPTNSWPVAALPDGRILVERRFDYLGTFLSRLAPNGQLDPTFDSSASHFIWFHGVVPAAEGKIWVLKHTQSYYASASDEILQRLNANGSIDQSWGGATITSLEGYLLHAPLISLPNGNLLVVHEAAEFPNGHPRGVLTRLLVNAPLPRFEGDPASAAVAENAGRAAIQIVRCGPNTEPITVEWRTEGGTAIPRVDYLPASGTLSFAANQSVATIELEVLDNPVVDEDRTVRLQMQGPAPQSREYPVIEVTILNDELGFAHGGIRRFSNGRVLLRPSGWQRPPRWEGLWGKGPVDLQGSADLKNWNPLGWFDPWKAEVMDDGATTNAVRFYRLRTE